jgi:serine/threonine-protein kinase
VGANVEQASATLSALGLQSKIIEERFDEDIAKGRVISTDPTAGDSISPGGVVSLTVSKGAERYAIPSLKDITTQAALNLLAKTPLRAGDITEVFSSTVPKGLVISSNPKSGTQVKRDTLVDLVVSKGIETFDLASYVGKNGEQALNELTTRGFNVTPTYIYDEVVMPGEVISQKPVAGVALPAGATVEIFISKGSAFVFIPNVMRYTQERAVAVLEDLGLTVVVKKVTKTSKLVIGINPKVNTKVKRGTQVTLSLRNQGPARVSEPTPRLVAEWLNAPLNMRASPRLKQFKCLHQILGVGQCPRPIMKPMLSFVKGLMN